LTSENKFPPTSYSDNPKKILGRKSTIQRMIKTRESRIQFLKDEIDQLDDELRSIVQPLIDHDNELMNIRPTIFKKNVKQYEYWYGKVYWYKKNLKDPVKGKGFYSKGWIWFHLGSIKKVNQEFGDIPEDELKEKLRELTKIKFYEDLKD
jgi:hypothetical protein